MFVFLSTSTRCPREWRQTKAGTQGKQKRNVPQFISKDISEHKWKHRTHHQTTTNLMRETGWRAKRQTFKSRDWCVILFCCCFFGWFDKKFIVLNWKSFLNAAICRYSFGRFVYFMVLWEDLVRCLSCERCLRNEIVEERKGKLTTDDCRCWMKRPNKRQHWVKEMSRNESI